MTWTSWSKRYWILDINSWSRLFLLFLAAQESEGNLNVVKLYWTYNYHTLKTHQNSFNLTLSIIFFSRRCSGCKKKRSLRANSFFEEFPRVTLGTLLLVIFYFVSDDSQKKTAQILHLSPALVCKVYRRLQDVCSRDLADRPVIPFGGPGIVVKCDESKFNDKPRVRHSLFYSLFSFQENLNNKAFPKTW